MDGQGTKLRKNIAENFNRLSRVQKDYRWQTDGRRHIANVRWPRFFGPVYTARMCYINVLFMHVQETCKWRFTKTRDEKITTVGFFVFQCVHAASGGLAWIGIDPPADIGLKYLLQESH